jgi:hypothetical protein
MIALDQVDFPIAFPVLFAFPVGSPPRLRRRNPANAMTPTV